MVNGEIQIVLKEDVAEDVQVILASYDGQGKMTTVTYGTKTADDTWTFSVENISENAEWKLLYSNADYEPVQEALKIELTETK